MLREKIKESQKKEVNVKRKDERELEKYYFSDINLTQRRKLWIELVQGIRVIWKRLVKKEKDNIFLI